MSLCSFLFRVSLFPWVIYQLHDQAKTKPHDVVQLILPRGGINYFTSWKLPRTHWDYCFPPLRHASFKCTTSTTSSLLLQFQEYKRIQKRDTFSKRYIMLLFKHKFEGICNFQGVFETIQGFFKNCSVFQGLFQPVLTMYYDWFRLCIMKRETARQTDRQMDRQIDRQIDRQTDRQTHRQT